LCHEAVFAQYRRLERFHLSAHWVQSWQFIRASRPDRGSQSQAEQIAALRCFIATGVKVQIVGFQKHSRPELPDYLGLRELTPGQRVELVVDIGLRGGLRPTLRGEH
jgi:hypothetical protein